MNPHEELKKICDTLNKELERANEKISRAGGSITGDDLSYIDRLTHAIKSVKTTIAMIESEEDGESGYYMPRYGYYGRSYASNRGNNGGMNGGSYARGRDRMGRYTSRRGGMSYDDGMIEELRDLMDRAPDEATRREFHKLINKLEQM